MPIAASRAPAAIRRRAAIRCVLASDLQLTGAAALLAAE
jgi:hypothetical protein